MKKKPDCFSYWKLLWLLLPPVRLCRSTNQQVNDSKQKLRPAFLRSVKNWTFVRDGGKNERIGAQTHTHTMVSEQVRD